MVTFNGVNSDEIRMKWVNPLFTYCY